jgi:hypothetical protein
MAQHEQPDWQRFVIEASAATGFQPAPTETKTAPTPLPAAFFGPPQFDPIELLPPAAAEKLRLLRQRRDDRHRLIPEFEDVRAASLARIDAENRLKQLQAHPQEFGANLPATDARLQEAQRTLDKASANFRRLMELQEVRSAAF